MADPHAHEDFPVAVEAVAAYERLGGVDRAVLSRLVGAAMAACGACQSSLLDQLGELPVTVAKLVEISVWMLQDVVGGVPRSVTEVGPGGSDRADYLRVVEAGMSGQEQGVVAAVESLTVRRRRGVADVALDMVAGVLQVRLLGGDG